MDCDVQLREMSGGFFYQERECLAGVCREILAGNCPANTQGECPHTDKQTTYDQLYGSANWANKK